MATFYHNQVHALSNPDTLLHRSTISGGRKRRPDPVFHPPTLYGVLGYASALRLHVVVYLRTTPHLGNVWLQPFATHVLLARSLSARRRGAWHRLFTRLPPRIAHIDVPEFTVDTTRGAVHTNLLRNAPHSHDKPP